MAIAPAGYRSDRVPRINTIGVPAHAADDAALETARGLAERSDADLVARGRGVDLLVIGSRDEAPVGRVMVSARARNEIESATAPVLVVARGVPLRFAVTLPSRSRARPGAAIVGRVRTLLISDLHLGTRLEYDVLRRPVALDAPARRARGRRPACAARRHRRVDGGASTAGDGGRRTGPTGDRAGSIGPDGEIIVVPGNHDRPLVRAWARRAGETLRPDSAVPLDASRRWPASCPGLRPASVRVFYPGVWLDRARLGDPRPLPRLASDAGLVVRICARRIARRPAAGRGARRSPTRPRPAVDDAGDPLAAATVRDAGRRLRDARPRLDDAARAAPPPILGTRLSPLTSHLLGDPDATSEHPRPGPRRPPARASNAEWVVFGHVHRLGPLRHRRPRRLAWSGRPTADRRTPAAGCTSRCSSTTHNRPTRTGRAGRSSSRMERSRGRSVCSTTYPRLRCISALCDA